MSEEGVKVSKNAVFLMLAEGIRRLFSFVIVIILARYLSVAHFGIFSLAFALVWIFSVFANFGMNPLLTRNIARDHSQAQIMMGDVQILKVVFYAATTLAIYGTCRALSYDALTVHAILIATAGLFFQILEDSYVGMFDAYQRMEFSGVVAVVKTSAVLLVVLVVVNAGGGLLAVVTAYLLANVASLSASVILSRKFIGGLDLSVNRDRMIGLIREAYPFLLIGLVWIIAFRVDMVMLSKLRTEQEVGLYRVSYSLFEVLLVLPALFSRALYPAFSRMLGTGDLDGTRRLFQNAIRIFAIISLPMCAGLYFLGPRFVVLFFGEKYAASGPVLSFFGLFLWLWFVTPAMGWALTAADRLKLVLKCNVASMLVNIGANFALIPLFGFPGAAGATVLSEIVLMVSFLVVVRRDYRLLSVSQIPFKPILATLVMGAFCFLLGSWNLLFVVAASAAVYFLVLLITGTLGKAELDLARKMLGSFKRG